MKRRLTRIVCALGLAGWAIIACYLLFSGSDQATAGLDTTALAAVTLLFALTTVPAFLLNRTGRFPNAALALALAFPLAFLLLFALIVASLP